MREVAQIVEFDMERDRKACITLFHHVTGANRELAKWLLDHPRYSGTTVGEWLGKSDRWIRGLRQWAKDGMPGDSPTSGKERARYRPNERNHGSDSARESQENSSESESEGGDGVASPEEIRENILDSIDRHAAVARSYKKIFKASSLDQAMKDEVSNAIGDLITTWQSLQRVLRPGGK